MPIPSRVLGAGVNSLATVSICGDGVTGLVAAGTTAATALQLKFVYNQVATTAASSGVKLPITETGELIVVANDGANSLTVYPQTGSTIDGVSSVSIATTKRAFFIAVSLTAWVSILGA